MRIVFVCKHNRFRSKIAEAYFRKINKNKKIECSSAGIFKGIPVAKSVISVGKSLGLKIKRETNCLKESLFRKTDIIVIVADNVPPELFRGKKIIVWKIKDADQNDVRLIKQRSLEIMKRVKKLADKLKRQR